MRTLTRPAVARTPGRSTAPAAWPGAGVRFAARPAAERLTGRIMQRPDDHQMSATARRSPSRHQVTISARCAADLDARPSYARTKLLSLAASDPRGPGHAPD